MLTWWLKQFFAFEIYSTQRKRGFLIPPYVVEKDPTKIQNYHSDSGDASPDAPQNTPNTCVSESHLQFVKKIVRKYISGIWKYISGNFEPMYCSLSKNGFSSAIPMLQSRI